MCAIIPLQDDLGKETCQRLRKIIISAILCTDMSNHFSMTQDFRKRDTSVRIRRPSIICLSHVDPLVK
jgi:hypothetical protein